MENKVRGTDFHVHYSDETAPAIIEEAKNKGLIAIGLIGRTELSGLIGDFIELGGKIGVIVIPGVEYLAEVDKKKAELIILLTDTNDPAIRKYYGVEENLRKNAEIAAQQRAFLANLGFSFDDLNGPNADTLVALLAGRISEKAIRFCELAVSNLNNASLIEDLKAKFPEDWNRVNSNYRGKPSYLGSVEALNSKFLWSLYFAPGKPGFIPVQQTSEKIISAVHQAEGVVLYSPEGRFDNDVWQKLIKEGVDGIMGWHGARLELSKNVIRYVRKRGLLILGGSDFEPIKDDWQMGTGYNNTMFCSDRRYKELIKYLERNYGQGVFEK